MTAGTLPTLALSAAEAREVASILESVLPNATVRVFGSRATGRARPFSDLDLLIVEPPQLTFEQRADLRDRFEASTLAFRVDVIDAVALAGIAGERILRESLPFAVHPAEATTAMVGPTA